VHIRAERDGDRSSIRDVHLGAFEAAGPQVCRLVDTLRDSTVLGRSVSLVAEEDGDVIGHVMLSHHDAVGLRDPGA
jgi:predicted N-acetyltransferase YhbS